MIKEIYIFILKSVVPAPGRLNPFFIFFLSRRFCGFAQIDLLKFVKSAANIKETPVSPKTKYSINLFHYA